MGTHSRLGASSPLRQIAESKLLRRILGYAVENASASGILLSSSAIIVQLDNVWVSVTSLARLRQLVYFPLYYLLADSPLVAPLIPLPFLRPRCSGVLNDFHWRCHYRTKKNGMTGW